MPKVFVSHAVSDKRIVDAFVDLLHSGMNIDFNEIYCTSHGKLKNGEYFVEEIRQNLINSEVVFLLLSNNFFASNFCLNEMGATWVLGKPLVPILVPPCGFAKLENTALKGMQACRIHI